MSVGYLARWLVGIRKTARRFGRVFVNREIAKVVDCIRFLDCPDEKRLVVFAVGRAGHSQDSRNVGGRDVAAELRSK